MNTRNQQVLKFMVENGCTMGDSMRKAGYSYAYSRNPQKVKNTKAWKELIKDYFNDDELIQKTEELLNAMKTSRTSSGLIASEFPDYKIRLKALDMIYKLKGYYPSKKVIGVNEKPYNNLSLEQLNNEISRLEALIKR